MTESLVLIEIFGCLRIKTLKARFSQHIHYCHITTASQTSYQKLDAFINGLADSQYVHRLPRLESFDRKFCLLADYHWLPEWERCWNWLC